MEVREKYRGIPNSNQAFLLSFLRSSSFAPSFSMGFTRPSNRMRGEGCEWDLEWKETETETRGLIRLDSLRQRQSSAEKGSHFR